MNNIENKSIVGMAFNNPQAEKERNRNSVLAIDAKGSLSAQPGDEVRLNYFSVRVVTFH